MIAAVVQLCSGEDLEKNLNDVEIFVTKAHARGAQFITVPENFAYLGNLVHKLSLAEPVGLDPTQSPILFRMAQLAKRLGVHLLLGGTPTRSDDQKRCFNTAVLLNPLGEIAAHYHKIHLFDVHIPGRAEFRESNFVMPGTQVVTAHVGPFHMGISICYDVRFPELYRRFSELGCELAVVPAAFTLHTGKDHWHTLLRARAIENVMYVLAPAQVGAHSEKRHSYGKSCIIDPWGAIVAEVSDEPGIAVAELDFNYLRRMRRELPCLEHRRL